MELHEDQRLFLEILGAASTAMSINPIFLEKDYWITRALRRLAQSADHAQVVFKGGTSLSKGWHIGHRFSEDLDLAIAGQSNSSGNQQRNLLRRVHRYLAAGLPETQVPGKTSKGSRYYKVYHEYPSVALGASPAAIATGKLLLEISSFANPHPYVPMPIQSLVANFLASAGHPEMISEFHLEPFHLNILDKRQTFLEKLVALIRASLASQPSVELSRKIRHFYDLHYLRQDNEVQAYLSSGNWARDFLQLFRHDQDIFDFPGGWQDRSPFASPLVNAFEDIWPGLEKTYLAELSSLVYSDFPLAEEVKTSAAAIFQVLGNHLAKEAPRPD